MVRWHRRAYHGILWVVVRAVWLWGLLCTACVATSVEPETDTVLPAITQDASPCAVPAEEAHTYTLPVWDLAIAQRDWDRLHADLNAEIDVPASVCVAGRAYPIELELQGSSTRKLPKKSFDLKFTNAQPLAVWPYTSPQPTAAAPIHKVLLKAMAKDQTLVREAVSFDMYRALGYSAPRTGFVNLRINGRYWGLYNAVEPVNDAYVSSRGLPTPGRLYKGVRKYGSFADFAPGRELTRAFELKVVQAPQLPAASDEDLDPLADAELKSVPSLPAYEDLDELVTLLQTTPLEPTAFERDIDPVFPLNAYLDRMLWVAFTQNGDAVAQNFYLFASQAPGTSAWTQLAWDSDISLGADWRDPQAWLSAQDALLLDGGNYFSQRLLKVPGMKARYRDRFLQALEAGTLARTAFIQLDAYRALIGTDLSLDAERWQRELDPNDAFTRLSEFVAARSSALRDALLSF